MHLLEHAVTQPPDQWKFIEHHVKSNGLIIHRGHDSTKDKRFADPERGPWTCESQMSLENGHEGLETWHVNLQAHMEELFFCTEKKIVLKHLLEVAKGFRWENVHKNARLTIPDSFQKQNMLERQQRKSLRAQARRGLGCAAVPMNLHNGNPQAEA